MPKARILLADNNADFLRIWAELLRRRDYEVVLASSVAMAKEEWCHGGIDVAILDLRLEDDSSEHDESGLELARALDPISTIIMTGNPNTTTLLWAMQENHTSRFLSVVQKQQGPDVLLKEIAKALLR